MRSGGHRPREYIQKKPQVLTPSFPYVSTLITWQIGPETFYFQP